MADRPFKRVDARSRYRAGGASARLMPRSLRAGPVGPGVPAVPMPLVVAKRARVAVPVGPPVRAVSSFECIAASFELVLVYIYVYGMGCTEINTHMPE